MLVGLGTSLNQIAYIDQLAEHEIVQCCELLVELGGIGALGVVRTSPQIIHVVTFQPPVLDAACQPRNISQRKPKDVLRSTKGLNSLPCCFGIFVLLLANAWRILALHRLLSMEIIERCRSPAQQDIPGIVDALDRGKLAAAIDPKVCGIHLSCRPESLFLLLEVWRKWRGVYRRYRNAQLCSRWREAL